MLLKFAHIRQSPTTFNPATNKIMKASKFLYSILLLFLQASRIDGFSPHTVQHSRIAAFGTSASKFHHAPKNVFRSRLSMTNTPLPEGPMVVDERLREEDPIEYLSQEVGAKMNMNTIFNTAALVLIGVGVLNQLVTVDAAIMRGWSVEEMAVRIPVDNWYSYSSILDKSPIQTKAITSATVYAIGDFIAQRTEGRNMGEIDRPRLLRSLLAGLIGHGPMSHIWYGVSEDLFENVLHLHDWWGTLIKVAIDQSLWGPLWNNTYILLLGLMKMDKLDKIFSEMKRTTIPLIVSGLKLWPLAHLVTYGLIPVENRLLWVDLIEIIWVTILATSAAGGEEDGEEQKSIH